MPPTHAKYPPEFRESVVNYYLDGHGSVETGAAFEVSAQSVTNWVRAAGHQIRVQGAHVGHVETAMQVHKNGAAKPAPKTQKAPPVSPVEISELPREIKRQLPRDVERVQILNSTTVIVWNSVAQRRALQTEARRNYA